MSDKLLVEQVENSPEQLRFMPLRGEIRLKLSDTVSPEIVKRYVKILRTSFIDGTNKYSKTYSDMYTKDVPEFIDVEVDANGNTLIIRAKDSFLELSNYILYISKDVYTVVNDISIGGAVTNKVHISPPTEEHILIQPQTPVVETEDGKVFIASIKSSARQEENIAISMDEGVFINGSLITFDKDVEITDEPIVIKASISKILDEDYSLEFSTGTAINLEEKVPIGTSSKLTADNVMSFYNSPYSELVSGVKTSVGTLTSEPVAKSEVKVEIRHPNKILYKFERPIDKTSIDIDAMEVWIYEAFDNHHLSKMGFYDDEEPMILEYSLHRGDTVLLLELLPNDTDELFPDRLIKRWRQ